MANLSIHVIDAFWMLSIFWLTFHFPFTVIETISDTAILKINPFVLRCNSLSCYDSRLTDIDNKNYFNCDEKSALSYIER